MGIVVDDAIVVGEAIYVHRKQGKPPLKAAVDGVSEVGMPVIAAVITTIVAFIPLLYVGGIMGKFIAIMPVVVIACLAVSLLECLLLLPAHLSHLPDPNTRDNQQNTLTRSVGDCAPSDQFRHGMVCGPYLYTTFKQSTLLALYFILCCHQYPTLDHRTHQRGHTEV